jgi:RNase H-like domain found in reverse transcriptase
VLSLSRAGWRDQTSCWILEPRSDERGAKLLHDGEGVLAIVWAVLQLRPYLEGKHFVFRTDHNSLRWVLNLAYAQGRLARWRLRLLEFDFEVQYAPGKEQHGADTLSRLRPSDPSLAEPTTAVNTEIPCYEVSRPTLQSSPRNLHPRFSSSKLDSTTHRLQFFSRSLFLYN